jgi:hypothetical protein
MTGSSPAAARSALAGAPLTKTERRICDILIDHIGSYVAHERIIDHVYHDDHDGGPIAAKNVIAVTILRLQDKIVPLGFRIETQNTFGRKITWDPSAYKPEAAQPRADTPITAAKPPVPSKLRDGDVSLGEAEQGGEVGIELRKLIEGRLLIQGTSGAGKSWTLRRLIEQSFGQVQQIIVDPEGEFKVLAEKYGHLHIAAHKLDVYALTIAARRAREHRISILLDLSDLDRDGQMMAVATFFIALIDMPRDHWHQVAIFIDEAHLFAPFGGQSGGSTVARKAAIGAVTDLMSRGRKRGLCGILATQRIARLAKSVISEVHNFMIGLNTLDLDIRRAAETIGWDARRGFDRLPALQPGDFVVVGPAFSLSPTVLKVGPVLTKHVGETPSSPKPADIEPDAAAKLLELEALVAASAADKASLEENALVPGQRAVRGFIRSPHFVLAARIWAALVPLVPEGARLSDLAAHLAASTDDILGATALLDEFGALEFTDVDGKRVARIAKGMRP